MNSRSIIKLIVTVMILFCVFALSISLIRGDDEQGNKKSPQSSNESQVIINESKYPSDEIFYVVPLQGMSLAIRQNKEDGRFRIPDTSIDVVVKNGNIKAFWGTEEIPGYYESWQSWSSTHQENGIVY